MTPAQQKLARHALGLDNPDARGKSYRNRYFAAADTFDVWERMVAKGYAIEHPCSRGMRHFELTIDGARAALKKGERLCPEDFPEQVNPVA